MDSYAFDTTLRATVAQRLALFDIKRASNADLRAAAVAIVIASDARSGQASVLMTLRPQTLNRHGGQYALPGGRLDPGETVIDAARRELQEELGLDLPETEILGRLDDFATRSGFCMSPIVMWAPRIDALRPDPSEVAEVFHLPFSELNSPDIPHLRDSGVDAHPVMSAYFPTLGHHMYAPTAAILYQFREVVMRGQSTRVAHFDQPQFAWK